MNPRLTPLAAGLAVAFGLSFNTWGAPPDAPPVSQQNQNAQGNAAPLPASRVPLPAPTVFPSARAEFAGISWGTFLAYPDVTFAATYDDNIYAERTNSVEDMVYTLSSSLELKSKWARHAFNLDLGADTDRYRNQDAENVSDYWLGFDGRYDLSRGTYVFGGTRHTRDHEDRGTPGSLLSQTEPTRYDHEEAHLGMATAAGQWRLRAGGTWDRYDYRDGVLGNGSTVDQDYRDHDLNSLGLRVGYALSPRVEVFGQVASDRRSYERAITGQTFNRDSDGYRVAAGTKFTLPAQRLSGEAFAGLMRQNYDTARFSDLQKPYFSALATWKPTSTTTATAFVDRSLEETVVNDGVDFASGSLDTTYGFEVERRLNSRLSVNGRAAYTQSDFQNYARGDTIIDAGAGLRYYVLPTVFVAADLRVIDRDSNELNAQYSRNQLLVSVGYTPARNRDYAILPEPDTARDAAPYAQGTLSGPYLGAQFGYGSVLTHTWGPRDGGGSDAADMGGLGSSYALFGGWGTEVGKGYLGVEIDAGDSGANWYHKKDKDDSGTMFVDKGRSYGLNLRAGYLLDGGLLYGKLGAVRTAFHTYYAENLYPAGAFDRDHTETGRRIGFGLEIPASRQFFVRTDYSYTDYDNYDVTYQSDVAATTTERFDVRENVFSIGLGWRFGGVSGQAPALTHAGPGGLYAGASLGHGTLATQATGTHDIGGAPGDYAFTGEFAHPGFTGGVFAGYGHRFDRFYVGLEFDAEASNLGWYHDRDTNGGGGRDFAIEKRGSYGALLRIGYTLDNGTLVYMGAGPVRTRFNTVYNRGNNAANWIDRSDTLDGTRVGLGAEVPASRNSFVRMDYSYTRYGDSIGLVTNHAQPDAMNFENSESTVRLGLGFRF